MGQLYIIMLQIMFNNMVYVIGRPGKAYEVHFFNQGRLPLNTNIPVSLPVACHIECLP
jgi:hypothetical protein